MIRSSTVTTIGLLGHVAGLIGQHHWNTRSLRYFLGVFGNFSRRAIRLSAGVEWLRCHRLCAVAQLVRNRGTSVAPCFTWCGNVDALHSRLKHLRLWRAGSERTPESSPHLSRVGASAPLGPSGATSRVMTAVKFIRLNGKPFFSNACPPPCHVPSASQTQCGIKPRVSSRWDPLAIYTH